jgi:hypothetical protein
MTQTALYPLVMVFRQGLPSSPQSIPLRLLPESGVAVTVTTVPIGNFASQGPVRVCVQFSFSHGFPDALIRWQFIPVGLLVTTPLPQPSIQTDNVLVAVACVAAEAFAGISITTPLRSVVAAMRLTRRKRSFIIMMRSFAVVVV